MPAQAGIQFLFWREPKKLDSRLRGNDGDRNSLTVLSYRHAYHAGNFADVFKHVVLVELITALKRKDKPFFALDTHAGAGLYRLDSAPAQKLREYETGIGRLWRAPPLPEILQPYLDLVRGFNTDGALRCYPGSPLLLRELLRRDDRLALAELHPSDHASLERHLRGASRVRLQQADGLALARALLPPKEARGLVFVDPPYELDREWRELLKCAREINRRWRGGMLALWYPLLPGRASTNFVQGLTALGIPKTLRAEIEVGPVRGSHGMYGCGMAVINPPLDFEGWLGQALSILSELLAVQSPRWRMDWLVPESSGRNKKA